MSEQINLDKGEGQIESGHIIDDIRICCSELVITFNCPSKLKFSQNLSNFITYRNISWKPCSFKESYTQAGTWRYSCDCFPLPFDSIVMLNAPDTLSLARSCNLELSSVSKNLKFKYPVYNMPLFQIINHQKLVSFEEGYRNNKIQDAIFIYFDSKYLHSFTWGDLMHRDSLRFQESEKVGADSVIEYIDDQDASNFASNRFIDTWKEQDYILKILGRKFEILSPTLRYFMYKYTISFTDIPDFDSDCDYLCVRCDLDITSAQGMKCLFSEIKYV